jgi:hypothetical protein
VKSRNENSGASVQVTIFRQENMNEPEWQYLLILTTIDLPAGNIST